MSQPFHHIARSSSRTRALAGLGATLVFSAAFVAGSHTSAREATPSPHAGPDATPASASQAQAADGGPIRHVVVFKYKATATPDQIRQVTEAFAALRTSIPGITAFEHGVNNSPEGKNHGFTHAYVMTFTDAKARDTYLPHPEHRKFGQLLATLGIVEDVFVVDYVPQS
jgi:hypothetical protein